MSVEHAQRHQVFRRLVHWPSIYFIGALKLKRACCLFTREARLFWQEKTLEVACSITVTI